MLGCSYQKKDAQMLSGQRDLMSYSPCHTASKGQAGLQADLPSTFSMLRETTSGTPSCSVPPWYSSPTLPHEFILPGGGRQGRGTRRMVTELSGCGYWNPPAPTSTMQQFLYVCIFTSFIYFYLKQTAPLSSQPFINEEQ